MSLLGGNLVDGLPPVAHFRVFKSEALGLQDLHGF